LHLKARFGGITNRASIVAMIRDISQPLRVAMPVWPGDTQFRAERTWHLSDTVPVNVSRITLSTHAGSHADAPLHYAANDRPIDRVALEPYIGPAQLIDLRGGKGCIGADDVLSRHRKDIQRVLLRTYERAPLDRWDSDFRAVDAQVIEGLSEQGVVLIGVDMPSLDPQESKSMDAHKAILRHDMRVLEGLVFDDVPEGVYELIALPLKLTGLDAAPVRAVLRDLPLDADHA
jgi:arylformamidase